MLSHGDARRDLPEHCGDVAILDILQFFDDPDKTALLESAAARVAPGGTLIVRSGIIRKKPPVLRDPGGGHPRQVHVLDEVGPRAISHWGIFPQRA